MPKHPDSSRSTATSPQEEDKIVIRSLKYSDIPKIANIAATTYFDSDLSAFLCPRRHEHPSYIPRRFRQMTEARVLNPRNIGFVAVKASSPEEPVGYALFIRLGDDEAALRLIAQQSSFWLTVRKWWTKIRTWIENFIWPDPSVDHDAVRRFNESEERDRYKYWMAPEMKAKYGNRWHAQSVVVSPSYQRRGIGRLLMNEILQRAQDEGVVVGLEASVAGEGLYRKLGFELRGPFSMTIGLSGGGIMMWTPSSVH